MWEGKFILEIGKNLVGEVDGFFGMIVKFELIVGFFVFGVDFVDYYLILKWMFVGFKMGLKMVVLVFF